MSGDARVRIDKWLWAARFFKTRTRAAAEIELGRVRVDGERVKPAHIVAIGARLEIALSDGRIEAIVRALSDVRGSAPVARLLYEETPESVALRQRRADLRRYGAEPAMTIKGRPTKKEGRTLRSLRRGR